MRNLQQAIENANPNYKIRVANFVKQAIKSNKTEINEHNGTLNTLIGLLAKGDMNCAGDPIPDTLFGSDGKPTVEVAAPQPIPDTDQDDGKVQPVAASPEQAKEPHSSEEGNGGKEPRKGQENSTGSKIRRGLSKFWRHLMEEEEN